MGTLLKNSDGKILRNSDGKVLKQNYNFGNAFSNGTTLSVYIDLLPVFPSTSNELTIVEFIDNVDDLNGNGSIYMLWGSTQYLGGFNHTSASTGVNLPQGKLMRRVRANLSGYDLDGKYFASENPANKTLELFRLGQHDTKQYDLTPDFYMGNLKIGELQIYNRYLSDNELNYINNNNLGNEPLSIVSLVLRYKFQSAEILDFSVAQDGSDMRVGVRNYGSIVNGHGEIKGLPAGTLEEKRDYANTNYFLLF